MSELRGHIENWLADLALRNSSEHTLRNYRIDVEGFHDYFAPPGTEPPASREFDALAIREWLGHLYGLKLSPVTIRRKIAAARSFFRFLLRRGIVEINPAKLVLTPKIPKTLPRVLSAEKVNNLVDGVARDRFDKPYPERDLLVFEFLYGCGVRVSELDAGCAFGARGRRNARFPMACARPRRSPVISRYARRPIPPIAR